MTVRAVLAVPLLYRLGHDLFGKREAIIEVMQALDLRPEELRELCVLELEAVETARAAGARAFAVATGSCTAAQLAAAGAVWVGSDLSALASHLLASGPAKIAAGR